MSKSRQKYRHSHNLPCRKLGASGFLRPLRPDRVAVRCGDTPLRPPPQPVKHFLAYLWQFLPAHAFCAPNSPARTPAKRLEWPSPGPCARSRVSGRRPDRADDAIAFMPTTYDAWRSRWKHRPGNADRRYANLMSDPSVRVRRSACQSVRAVMRPISRAERLELRPFDQLSGFCLLLIHLCRSWRCS